MLKTVAPCHRGAFVASWLGGSAQFDEIRKATGSDQRYGSDKQATPCSSELALEASAVSSRRTPAKARAH